MREMVFRERHEKVAFVDALTQIVGRIYNLDHAKAFGSIVGDYASEVFQETYDADMLVQKIAMIRAAQARLRNLRITRERHLSRLDRMGEYYDRKMGVDLIPTVDPSAPTGVKGGRKDPG